jgi:sulfur-carrier protein adenylyltransferase/sulfurtransferase
MNFITVKELQDMIAQGNRPYILDIREPYEFEICSIKSVHIPMGEVNTKVNEIPRNEKVVVMCKSGNRAQALTNFLEKEHSFTNLEVLEGGILAWIEEVDTHLEAY